MIPFLRHCVDSMVYPLIVNCTLLIVCSYFTVKAADAVSLTSCDSSDSCQLSALPTQAPVPQSSSSSTISEDCSSESAPSKSPPLVVSIDLELLRKDDAIVEVVTHAVQHCPAKLLPDSDAESAGDGANGISGDAADSAENCTAARNADEMPEIVDQTADVDDDDFESIYPSNFADWSSTEMSLDDGIMESLMTSRADDFRNVVQPVAFSQCPGCEACDGNHVNDQPTDVQQFSIPGQVAVLHGTANSGNCISRSQSATGSRQSTVVNNWIQLPAPANVRSLSVSSRHVWCVDVSGQLLYSQLHGPGLRWFVVTTAPAQQISVSPSGSLVWRLDDGSVYAARNVTARQPWGNKWSAVARDVTWVSADNHVAW